jgi:phage gp29-like protein
MIQEIGTMIKKAIATALVKAGAALLKTPQAGPRSAQSHALNYASVNTLDPSRLAQAFAAADRGDITHQSALFELIEEQDSHVFGELSKRRRAVTGLGWRLEPKDDATQAELDRAAELDQMLRAIPNLEDAEYDLTDAIGKGFAAMEINWASGDVWLPRPGEDGRPALHFIPQRMFKIETLGPETGQMKYLKEGVPVPLTPGRWLIHEHRAKSGYIEQAALFRVLAWTYAYKMYNVQDMQKFLEIYGLPLRIGVYPPGISDAERNQLLRAVRNIGHDGAGIIPDIMKIEYQEARLGRIDDFLDAITYWERKQSIAILGGTLTSQADGKTSTNALGDIHNQVRREIMLHDVRQIEPSINKQLVRPIALLNGMFPPDRVPVFAYQTEEKADQEKMVAVLAECARIGLEVDIGWAHRAMQIPRAGKDAQILKVGHAAPAIDDPEKNAAATAALSAEGNRPPADPVTQNAERLAATAQPAINEWLMTIETMLKTASSLEEFRGMVLAAWPRLPTEELVAAMSEAFIAMNLRGRAEVEEEVREGAKSA